MLPESDLTLYYRNGRKVVALVLAGHGSHVSPDTAGLVWSYVDQLRAWNVADEVTACFWKEAPAFNQVLDTIAAREIIIVPVFTAQGYFSKTVIPADMKLCGKRTERDGRIIHYTPTLGEHPDLTAIVQQRIETILAQEQLPSDDVAVAIIGHGTPRSQTSQDAAQQQAKTLRHIAAEVVAVYLDDEPTIPSVYETTSAPNIIAVPYFLATGSHVTQDVPQKLGIQFDNRSTVVKGRQVYYTLPIGTHELICQLILDLARNTGNKFIKQESTDEWRGFPQIGGEELMNRVLSNGSFQFGQLTLTPTAVQPINVEPTAVFLKAPATLRRHIREQPFRPLATSADLPQDWCVPVTTPQMLPAIVETVYPGVLADWSRRRAFKSETLKTFSERQTGMFKNIDTAPQSIIENAVQTICGTCIRFPSWHTSSDGDIPCKSPCNWWSTQVKEATA